MNDINSKRTNSAMMRKQKSAKYLTAPTRPVQIDRDRSVAGILMKMEGAGFQARTMADAHNLWLEMLADMEAANPPEIPTLSIYTLNDDLVYPPESSVLEWAENVPVSAIGHVALLFSEPVANRVIAAIRKQMIPA